ncbi:MAG: glycosyltransferase family 39 protein [Proteobacteria bacterium]|nr:glycosyltransferase family 39 protein [Pseudomonadota bacterium]
MTGTGHNRRTALYWSACALLAGVVVFGSVRPLLSIGRYLPLDPNEGWNAYFADAAVTGGTLYPPADALITNNYPPLSFYVVGAVGHLTGDTIFAGRVVALASLLFVVWSLYYWLRITGSAARIGLLAALTFLAYVVTYARGYVAMDDPQWLAHALMMGGLLVIWTGKDDARHLILGGVLMVAGGWTKHLLIPLPLAVSLWLLWRSRPAFARFALSAAVALALAAVLSGWLYGMRFFASFHEPREYLRSKAITEAWAALRCFAPLVVLWLWALATRRQSERLAFISLYLLISGIVALFAAGGAGVDVNVFFDCLIALCLAAGLTVESLWTPPLDWGPPAGLGLAVWLVGYMAALAPAEIEAIRNIAANERSALRDIAIIKADGHNRAACENLNLCYWAKSAFLMDFFYFGQKLKTGLLPPTACADTFEHGKIALVQLESNLRYRAKLLPHDCDALITSRYHPVRESNFGQLLMHGANR